MNNNDLGRVASEQALVSDQAASRLAPSGFDPSRVMQEFYLSRYYEPKPERPADNVLAAIEYVNDLYLRPAHDEVKKLTGLCGWAARRLPPMWENFVLSRITASVDRNPEGGDGTAPSHSDESAAPKADAQPPTKEPTP